MSTNPYSQDDFSKASEYLRLALSLLSKHRIPPSPLNFRMGYDYIAGRNEELKTALDEVVTKSGGVPNEKLEEMYRRFFIQDEQSFDKMRNELRHTIANIQSELECSGGNTAGYMTTLNHFAEILDTRMPPETMSIEVQKVVDKTRTMEQAHHRFESNMTSIMAEMETMRKEMEQVKQESLTDALTGISNRKAFDAALQHAIDTAQGQGTPFCLLFADIDHFKQFNDTYGHLVGDKVLRFVSVTLKRCLKGKDMAARYGGEEFAVILPDTALTGAEAVAEQIRSAVSSGILKDKKSDQDYGRITISIGVAQHRSNELPDDLIIRADRALYLAKNHGRNRVEQAA